MRHEYLFEHAGGHFRVWIVVEEEVQRMFDSFFLAPLRGVLLQMERKSSDGLRQNADTKVNCRHLYGGSLRDGLPRGRAAQEEAITAPCCVVARPVPCAE